MVMTGEFREDFYYRLHVVPIHVPPLRDRREDIPLLVDYFMQILGADEQRGLISADILETLCQHSWPGNVRELQNLLQRFLAVNRFDFVNPSNPPPAPRMDTSPDTVDSKGRGLRELLHHYEKEILQQTLADNRWHRGKTARRLGIPERTLYRKLKHHQMLTA